MTFKHLASMTALIALTGAAHAAASKRPAHASPTHVKPLYWYDPMHPDKHFAKPGKSPFMNMQLVAKYPERSDRR